MNKTYVVTFIILVVAAAGAWIWYAKGEKPGQYDTFASCLKEKGATFYGAFWCPHCQAQKKLFGNSAKLLPYTECSLPNGQGQNETCNQAGITGYPTWQFADGSRLNGEQSLETLSQKTGCALQ
jgi:hypothetical protein